jgi:hypothetical protein
MFYNSNLGVKYYYDKVYKCVKNLKSVNSSAQQNRAGSSDSR